MQKSDNDILLYVYILYTYRTRLQITTNSARALFFSFEREKEEELHHPRYVMDASHIMSTAHSYGAALYCGNTRRARELCVSAQVVMVRCAVGVV